MPVQEKLRVRDLSVDDIPLVNAYWANQTPSDYARLSLDPQKVQTRFLDADAVRQRNAVPFRDRSSDALIWELNGHAVGISTLRNIRYGHDGEIHLHMIDARFRQSGYGRRFFALSLNAYFQRFELQL